MGLGCCLRLEGEAGLGCCLGPPARGSNHPHCVHHGEGDHHGHDGHCHCQHQGHHVAGHLGIGLLY